MPERSSFSAPRVSRAAAHSVQIVQTTAAAHWSCGLKNAWLRAPSERHTYTCSRGAAHGDKRKFFYGRRNNIAFSAMGVQQAALKYCMCCPAVKRENWS